MREHDRCSLAGAPLIHVRHQHRGNKKKAKVVETRAKDNSASNSDNKGSSLLQHKNTGISKSDEKDLLITTAALKKLAGEHRGNE